MELKQEIQKREEEMQKFVSELNKLEEYKAKLINQVLKLQGAVEALKALDNPSPVAAEEEKCTTQNSATQAS